MHKSFLPSPLLYCLHLLCSNWGKLGIIFHALRPTVYKTYETEEEEEERRRDRATNDGKEWKKRTTVSCVKGLRQCAGWRMKYRKIWRKKVQEARGWKEKGWEKKKKRRLGPRHAGSEIWAASTIREVRQYGPFHHCVEWLRVLISLSANWQAESCSIQHCRYKLQAKRLPGPLWPHNPLPVTASSSIAN